MKNYGVATTHLAIAISLAVLIRFPEGGSRQRVFRLVRSPYKRESQHHVSGYKISQGRLHSFARADFVSVHR